MKKIIGITLIALVITIVILIILAGVLINLTLGDNGLFTRSKIAKQKYEYGAAKEIVDIKLVDIQAECYSQGKEYNLQKISKDMTADTNITIDEKYFKPTSMKKEGVSDIHTNLKGIVVSANAHPQFKFLIGEEGNNIKVIGITTEDVPDTWTTGDLPKGFKKLDDFEEEIGAKDIGGNQTQPNIPPVEPVVTISNSNLGNKTRKTDIALTSLVNVTEGNVSNVSFAVTGTLKHGDNFTSQEITNISQLELGEYTIQVKSKLSNEVKGTISVNINALASTTVKNSSNEDESAKAIYSAYDLYEFASIVNNGEYTTNGKIMTPLDMSKVCYAEDTQKGITQVDWTPIGVYSDAQGTTAYKGIFDGNYQTIKGLYIKNNQDNQGLFGATKNALISGIVIDNTSYIEGKNTVGAIIGDARNTNIYKCGNSAEVKGINNVGGIAGYTNDSDIWEVYNKGNIYADEQEAGGIVGGADTTNNTSNNQSNFDNSYNIGDVTVGAKWVGGITGETNDGIGIYSCYNKGTITCTGDSIISDVTNAQVRWNYGKI